MTTDTLRFQLVRRAETKRAILDTAIGKRAPYHDAGVVIAHSMEELSQDFSRDNLIILNKLRKLGHVSLTEAAIELKKQSPEDLVNHLMDHRIINYLLFRPVETGEQGVIVPFNKIEINLDFEETEQ